MKFTITVLILAILSGAGIDSVGAEGNILGGSCVGTENCINNVGNIEVSIAMPSVFIGCDTTDRPHKLTFLRIIL